MKNGFANIAILVIVLLAAAGVGYVIMTRDSGEPPVWPSPTPSSQTASLEQIAALAPPPVYTVIFESSPTGVSQWEMTIYKDHDKVRIDRKYPGPSDRIYLLNGQAYDCDTRDGGITWEWCGPSDELQHTLYVFTNAEDKRIAEEMQKPYYGEYKGFVGRRIIAGVDAVCFANESRLPRIAVGFIPDQGCGEAVPPRNARCSPPTMPEETRTRTLCFHPAAFLRLLDQTGIVDTADSRMDSSIVATQVSFDPIPPETFRLPQER